MAYRSTKARITGKIASGGFNQPDNTLAKAIDTGAGIMSKSILRKAEEDRLEAREEKKRAAAAARSHAAAQAKKEEAARKQQRIATSIATRFGIEPTNKEGMAYVTNEVEIHGTGAISIIQKDYEDGKLQTPTVEITEDYVTGASPNQAPPMRLSPNPDGSPRTTLSLGKDIDDLEATDPSLADASRSAAESAFSPQQLYRGEVQTATTTSQGFKFDPTAKKKSKIDWTNVSEAQVKNLQRQQGAGKDNLSEEDAAMLAIFVNDYAEGAKAVAAADSKKANQNITQMDIPGLRAVLASPDSVYSQEEKATAQAELESKIGFASAEDAAQADEDSRTFRRDLVGKDAEYLRGIAASGDHTAEEKLEAAAQLAARPGEPFEITDYDDVKDATIQTIIGADGTDPQKVTALQALLSNRANTAPKVDAKSQDYLVTYLDEAGGQQVTVAKLAADGSGFVDLTSLKPVSPAEGTSPLNMEMQSDLYDKFVKINTSLIKPLKEQRVAMVTTLASAKKLDDLAKANETILTTVGGKIPAVLKRVGLETQALVDLFNSSGSVEGTLSLLDQRFDQYLNSTSFSGTARDAALFQAEKVKMAFMFAASSLGQSGQGLSDKDFLRALSILDQGSDYTTFSENIRSQMQAVILKTETMIKDFNEDGAISVLGGLDTSNQLLAGYQQDAKTYSANRGLGDAFTWANSAISDTNTSTAAVSGPTLEEFMAKARGVNSDSTDAELEAFWKNKYGGTE